MLLYVLGSNLFCLSWATAQVGVTDSQRPSGIEVADFGPIKKITGPSGWAKSDDSTAVRIFVAFTPKGQKEVRIGLLSWVPSIEQQSWDDFNKLLAANPNLTTSRLLFADKGFSGAKAIENVKALTRVLGINHVGNNQITNSRKPPDPSAPVFRLERLELQSLNRMTVLFAEGYFIDIHGKPNGFSSGIYVPYKRNRSNAVYQIYLEAPDKENFQRNIQAFQATLRSIQWTK